MSSLLSQLGFIYGCGGEVEEEKRCESKNYAGKPPFSEIRGKKYREARHQAFLYRLCPIFEGEGREMSAVLVMIEIVSDGMKLKQKNQEDSVC